MPRRSTRKMQAAVLHEYGRPLKLESRAIPEPGPGEVLLRVEACGVCHSDLHLAQGDWRKFAGLIKLPIVLGHEVVGRVAACGPDVKGWERGARAGVAWIHWSCGECPACRSGRENLCAARQITGVTVDGGYAGYLKARASHIARVPESLSSREAAPLFCAGVTVVRALRLAGVSAGDRIAVFGIGGLGHLAVQAAVALGARVMGVDVVEAKLALARECGAEDACLADRDALRALRNSGGMDAVLVSSAAVSAYEAAVNCIRPGGTLIVVGLPERDLQFDATLLTAREIRIVSSAVGTREDIRATLDLATAGELRCRVEAAPLERLNSIFRRMQEGTIQGRVVVQP